jgi:ATP-binding cassette, subfamily C (CFTR/MRP), member 1
MGYISMSSGIKVRAALGTAISRRAITMSHISAEHTADVVGFMANDLGKVYDGVLVRIPTSNCSNCML